MAAPPVLSQTAGAPGPPAPVYVYAGMAGRLTQDRDALGGNPFASGLVEALRQDNLTLDRFVAFLAAGNARHSDGWHRIDMPRRLPDPHRRIDGDGRRAALVLINADYSKAPGVYSLPGAVFDAQRVPEALRTAGYDTRLVLDATADMARAAMAEFAESSAGADAAIVYVGGHGVQTGRRVYAVMGDYPDPKSRVHLATHAIALDELGGAARAAALNLVLYASCRDDPFVKAAGAADPATP